jgi:hypothetical protein
MKKVFVTGGIGYIGMSNTEAFQPAIEACCPQAIPHSASN